MATRREAAVLVVGHGSDRSVAATCPTLRLTEALGRLLPRAAVDAAFLRRAPILAASLSDQAIILPHFIDAGHFTRTVIPDAILRSGAAGVRITAPLGTHPLLPRRVVERLGDQRRRLGVQPAAFAVLLAAHGGRGGQASAVGERLRTAIAASGVAAAADLAYLAQAPHLEDWRVPGDAEAVVVVPLLLGYGAHARDDVPASLGLPSLAGAGDMAGPVWRAGRRYWLWSGPLPVETQADLACDLVAGMGLAANGRWAEAASS